MSNPTHTIAQSNSRLVFIDVARSLAIILMLQGHFISLTYKDYTEMSSLVYSQGTSHNYFFDFWLSLRGFTAPLFFTISGLVFTFLLTKNQSDTFWQEKRVRKGLVRGLKIIAWGYVLQLSARNISYYLSGRINDRFFAFHVLHCIGLGILTLILIYGICHYFKRLNLFLVLLACGLLVMGITPFVESLGTNYFPSQAPQFIQNMVRGSNSIFPIFPWFTYIFLGGAMGVMLNKHSARITKKHYPLRFIAVGVGVCLVIYLLVFIIDKAFDPTIGLYSTYIRISQIGFIILLIGILMYIDRWGKIKMPFFLAMGKNTLNIYIGHVILLYGAVIGIGIRTFYEKSLSFGVAVIGAIVFIVFFGFLTQLHPLIKSGLRRLLRRSPAPEKV